jgi:S-formylglutathione hydrolase FrmB
VTQLEAADVDAIVVMPEGASGWYADWANGGPTWETYELDDVLPTILAKYPILPNRQDHAIAGISMGGLGAVYLAGRLPGFFGSVATLSGFVDPQFFAPVTSPAMGLTALAPLKGDDNLNPVYGPPYGFYADGHNPTKLTMNLQQTRVFESTGTGIPSAAGLALLPTGVPQAAAILEGTAAEAPIIHPMNEIYYSVLVANHVDVTYQVHSGGHDIPDFDNEIAAFLAWGPFQPVAGNSALWRNDTVATSGQLWDIDYQFAQAPKAVVQIQQFGNTVSVSAAGTSVTITTAGGCTVQTSTPARFTLPTGTCR